MPPELDLADIQGNILTAYGKLGFPKGRNLLFNVRRPEAGRAFVEMVRPLVTSALRWPSHGKGAPTGRVEVERPLVALNIAFTFRGLLALDTPVRTLRGLPDEFIDGMAARARVLGDDFPADAPGRWDPVWRNEADPPARVHILVTLNAQAVADGGPVPELEAVSRKLAAFCDASEGGVVLLTGHGAAGTEAHQELSALFATQPDGTLAPQPTEHFGFVDAIGDPVFEGQLPGGAVKDRVVGGGKTDRSGAWSPLATGEFLLGYADEAQEIAGAAMPLSFSRNGTFVAYRKLQQNVGAFHAFIDGAAAQFGAVYGVPDPAQARTTLLAKLVGRWPDGVSLVLAPTFADWVAFTGGGAPAMAARGSLNAFTYAGDPDGARCPLGAHVRRGNTRDMLDPLGPSPTGGAASSALNNRRRILRRGLPYGAWTPPPAGAADERGIVMMSVCASLFRQFEFVQQQWINYGLDFNQGGDTCPLIGAHGEGAKFVIPAPAGSAHAPFILSGLPQFVETRGGAYFFMPSLTALRMIGQGLVDPT
jgi:deferrochelatase/peroxidase EfeB